MNPKMKTKNTGRVLTIDKLLTISDLNAEKIKSLTENDLPNYTETLNDSIHIFPVQKERLETAFHAMDYASVLQWFKTIRNSLSQIYADNLVKECEKQINLNQDIANIRHVRLSVFINYFLSTLTMFFAEIHQLMEEMELEGIEHGQEAQPVNVRESLAAIAELNAEKISKIPDDKLNAYIEALHTFHNEFPTQEHGLRSSVKSKYYPAVLQWLSSIEDSLKKIHADNLLEDCQNQINVNKNYDNIRHEKLEVFVDYFLSSLSLLSDDVITISLPAQKTVSVSGDADVEVTVKILSPGSSPSAKSIFAVNKTTIFLKNLKLALKDSGHELIGATSGVTAIYYLKASKPDLILLDDDIPDTDSFEFIKKIRELGRMAPIIFTTSNINKENMVKAMEAGVADFIIKPITTNDVQEKVAKHLKK
jgi:CheY-like chemotaxis protein